MNSVNRLPARKQLARFSCAKQGQRILGTMIGDPRGHYVGTTIGIHSLILCSLPLSVRISMSNEPVMLRLEASSANIGTYFAKFD